MGVARPTHGLWWVPRNRLLVLATGLVCALVFASSAAEVIRKFEIKRSVESRPGKLVVYVGDREIDLSTEATRAWSGWHPGILLFSEARSDGRQELRVFNSITGARSTVTVENGIIDDVTVARLDDEEYRMILFLRDPSGKVPSLAFADLRRGVYARFRSATAGAVVNDAVVVRHFRRGSVDANHRDLQKQPAVRLETVALATGLPLPKPAANR